MMSIKDLLNQMNQSERTFLSQQRKAFDLVKSSPIGSIAQQMKAFEVANTSPIGSIAQQMKAFEVANTSHISFLVQQMKNFEVASTSPYISLGKLVDNLNPTALSVKKITDLLQIPGFTTYQLISKDFIEFIENEDISAEIVEELDEFVNDSYPQKNIIIYTPFSEVLLKLKEKIINLDELHWRELEELVAELLDKDGFNVELGKGSKDGGVDIMANKAIEGIGQFNCIWQAKKLKTGKRVGLEVIQQLAAVRERRKANKAIIVTTNFLTQGAKDWIKEDEPILGKCERDELECWINRILQH